jgi:branched-chain amino acid transport system ATP-binding protein
LADGEVNRNGPNVPALEGIGLQKRFGALIVADNVSLQVPIGARLALIGPNGAGKTTLVGLLTGRLRADAGRILLHGHDVTHDAPARRVKQGLVRTFQINNLFRGLTVLENVFLAVSEHTGASFSLFRPAGRSKPIVERAEGIVEQLGLADVRHQTVSAISYGRQRLVEIALALALEPKVLLLDEPAAGIPSGETVRLLDTIAALPEDLAILLIEHDMHVVRRFAREVMVLVSGKVFMTGTPHEVMASGEVRRVYLGGAQESRRA